MTISKYFIHAPMMVPAQQLVDWRKIEGTLKFITKKNSYFSCLERIFPDIEKDNATAIA